MKSGDKVQIISYREIYDMFDPTKVIGLYDNLRFVSEMKKYCGTTVTLISSYRRPNRKGYVWNVEEYVWVWHEDWLRPAIKF